MIGRVDPADTSLLSFDLDNFVPRLPHQIALIIKFVINGLDIHRVVVDEAASTCSCHILTGKPLVLRP